MKALSYVVKPSPGDPPLYWEICALDGSEEVWRFPDIFRDEQVAEDLARAFQDANDSNNS